MGFAFLWNKLQLSYRVFRQFPSIPRIGKAEFINNGVKFINPMMFILGWEPSRIVLCEMHIVHLGICQWLNASSIILLAKYDYLGPGSLNDQLTVLTYRFNRWCSLNNIRRPRPWYWKNISLSNDVFSIACGCFCSFDRLKIFPGFSFLFGCFFVCNSLIMAMPWRHYQPYIPVTVMAVKAGEYPELRLKAWTSRVLTSFLAVCMKDLNERLAGQDEEVSMGAAAMVKLSDWMLSVERSPRLLSEDQANDLHLKSWRFLSSIFEFFQLQLYNLVFNLVGASMSWTFVCWDFTCSIGFWTSISAWHASQFRRWFSGGPSSPNFMHLVLV